MSVVMQVRRLVVVVMFGATLGVAGCGTNAPSRAKVGKALETSGVPAAEAQCSVQAIYDNLTTKQVADLYERGFGGVPKDNPTDSGDAATRLATAMAKCRDAAAVPTNPAAGGGESSTTVATSVPGAGIGSDDPQVDSSDPARTREPSLDPGTDNKPTTSKVPTGSNGLNDDPVPSTGEVRSTDSS